MFNNAIKKFASVGLVFSLCAPCSFASAQSFGRNGMGIPLKNSESQQNQTIDEEFSRIFLNIRIPAELLNLQPQRQPSALERLWNEYYGREYITIHGRHFNTAGEFANEARKIKVPPPFISRGILYHLIEGANIGLNEALTMTQEIIAEIYNLDKIEAGRYAMQALADLQAHPILSKLIFK